MSVGRQAPRVGDYCNYDSSGVVLYAGGNYNQNRNNGLFYLNGNNAASNKNANHGSRILAKLIEGKSESFYHRWVDVSHSIR